MGIGIHDKRERREQKTETKRERGREGERERERRYSYVFVSLPFPALTEQKPKQRMQEMQLLCCRGSSVSCSTRGVQIVTLKGQLLQYFLDESVIRQKVEKEEVHSIGPRLCSTAGQRSGLMQLRRGYTHRFCTSRAVEGSVR